MARRGKTELRGVVAVAAALLVAGLATVGTAGSVRAGPSRDGRVEAPPGWRDREMKSLAGGSAALGDWQGELLVVNFWASWCNPCRTELPLLDAWNDAWQERGARVVAVSVDRDEKRAVRFVEEAALAMPVLHDGPAGLARILDLPSLPCTLLLDRNGEIVARVQGSDADDLARLRAEVETRLAAAETSR